MVTSIHKIHFIAMYGSDCLMTQARNYGELLNKALQDFKQRWNTHKIRPSRTAGCPSGVPDDLYSLPELTGIDSL